jgi:hypothetical protein
MFEKLINQQIVKIEQGVPVIFPFEFQRSAVARASCNMFTMRK